MPLAGSVHLWSSKAAWSVESRETELSHHWAAVTLLCLKQWGLPAFWVGEIQGPCDPSPTKQMASPPGGTWVPNQSKREAASMRIELHCEKQRRKQPRLKQDQNVSVLCIKAEKSANQAQCGCSAAGSPQAPSFLRAPCAHILRAMGTVLSSCFKRWWPVEPRVLEVLGRSGAKGSCRIIFLLPNFKTVSDLQRNCEESTQSFRCTHNPVSRGASVMSVQSVPQ